MFIAYKKYVFMLSALRTGDGKPAGGTSAN